MRGMGSRRVIKAAQDKGAIRLGNHAQAERARRHALGHAHGRIHEPIFKPRRLTRAQGHDHSVADSQRRQIAESRKPPGRGRAAHAASPEIGAGDDAGGALSRKSFGVTVPSVTALIFCNAAHPGRSARFRHLLTVARFTPTNAPNVSSSMSRNLRKSCSFMPQMCPRRTRNASKNERIKHLSVPIFSASYAHGC